MGRKNQCGFKKRERRNFLQKLNDLSTVFQQEDFNPDHRCYRDIVETELEDEKVTVHPRDSNCTSDGYQLCFDKSESWMCWK